MSRELVELLIIAVLVGLILGTALGVFIGMAISQRHHNQTLHHVVKAATAGQRSRGNLGGVIDYEDAEDLFRH